MKALCKTKPEKGVEYKDVDLPKIKDDELLVKIYKTSICGSDIPVYNYTGWAPRRIPLPFVFGHELCGEVVETGKNTKGFEKGDFISVESHVFCGLCYQCRNDQRHVCSNMVVLGLDTQGGFSEYAAIPARCGWKHSDNKLKEIASIMEPLGNAVFATLVEDVAGKTVFVEGCGPQGLFAIEIAKACGAQKVIALEGSPYRQKMAEQMGADAIFSPTEEKLLEKIKKASGDPSGVDVVLEMSGHPDAVRLGLKAVKPAGRFTAFGLPGSEMTLDYSNDIVFKGIKVEGITGRQIYKSWHVMEGLLRSGKINPAPIITHTFEMKDYEKAFATMMDPERKCGKVVLIP
ncbi:Putative threonine dehydrogenase [Elusimicrobium minutum Pei191]|uniref:Putative threonine dehydrogenase n=1 Tax=Elusimicrobium minutum (strain Pei191) TaxID=445932 RepID=B2KBM4_ELUMP|nr:L-threonine 3-dehydrogenase [Elusimicrobium minutum]ACC97711.1 Putative threonine dehydrogenase [Elusimicrobium minutum Pei191]